MGAGERQPDPDAPFRKSRCRHPKCSRVFEPSFAPANSCPKYSRSLRDGYRFCEEHILEDPTVPRCRGIARGTGQRCRIHLYSVMSSTKVDEPALVDGFCRFHRPPGLILEPLLEAGAEEPLLENRQGIDPGTSAGEQTGRFSDFTLIFFDLETGRLMLGAPDEAQSAQGSEKTGDAVVSEAKARARPEAAQGEALPAPPRDELQTVVGGASRGVAGKWSGPIEIEEERVIELGVVAFPGRCFGRAMSFSAEGAPEVEGVGALREFSTLIHPGGMFMDEGHISGIKNSDLRGENPFLPAMEKFLDFVDEHDNPVLVAHNGHRFDVQVLTRFFPPHPCRSCSGNYTFFPPTPILWSHLHTIFPCTSPDTISDVSPHTISDVYRLSRRVCKLV